MSNARGHSIPNSRRSSGRRIGGCGLVRSVLCILLPCLPGTPALANEPLAAKPPAVQQDSTAPNFRFKKSNQILLDVGKRGRFDSCQAKYPSILKVGDEWWMWYNGRTDDCFTGSIGLATSRDGLKWTKTNDGDPIFKHGPQGSFDSTKVDHPAVLRFDGKYHMWYTAGNDAGRYTIGYATSPDGIRWTRQNAGKPVLAPGAAGKFDGRMLLHPAVVRADGGVLHIWYNGVGPQAGFLVGHATSRDGIHWERQNQGDPVVVPTKVGDFNERYVYNVHVLFEDGVFHMWYSSVQGKFTDGGHNALIYASSRDGTRWQKAKRPTLISGMPGSIDEYACFACYVVRRPAGLWMYFSVADKKQKYRVSLARQIPLPND